MFNILVHFSNSNYFDDSSILHIFYFYARPFYLSYVCISLLELSDNLLPSHASLPIGVKNNTFLKNSILFR